MYNTKQLPGRGTYRDMRAKSSPAAPGISLYVYSASFLPETFVRLSPTFDTVS
jgi:hypothetical protein